MIFGASESVASDGRSVIEADIVLASDILRKTNPDANIQGIKVFRVGRENPAKIRPMKVVLQSSNEVKSLIRRAKELKKNDLYKNISLSFDRTSKQIDEYKAMKRNLDSRIQSGETGLVIKYMSGCPKIVKIGNSLN